MYKCQCDDHHPKKTVKHSCPLILNARLYTNGQVSGSKYPWGHFAFPYYDVHPDTQHMDRLRANGSRDTHMSVRLTIQSLGGPVYGLGLYWWGANHLPLLLYLLMIQIICCSLWTTIAALLFHRRFIASFLWRQQSILQAVPSSQYRQISLLAHSHQPPLIH